MLQNNNIDGSWFHREITAAEGDLENLNEQMKYLKKYLAALKTAEHNFYRLCDARNSQGIRHEDVFADGY